MEQLLEEITSIKLADDDYAKISQFCDTYAIARPKDCVKAISQKLFGNVPSSSLRAARLLNYCTNNAGNNFNAELSSSDFLKRFINGFGKINYTVQHEICAMTKRLASEYSSNSHFDILVSIYNNVIRDKFPDVYLRFENEESYKKNRQQHTNALSKEEEAELAKAISLSMKESEKKKSEVRKSPVNAYEKTLNDVAQPVMTGQQTILKNGHPTVRALYDFEAAEDNELSFKEGDLITLLDATDANWWRGRLRNSEGLFPAQFVTRNVEEADQSRGQPSSSSKSVKFKEQKQITIEPDKVNQCLELLNAIDPEAPESADPPEINLLEHQCRQMEGLIDHEIQMSEEKLDTILALENKLKDVLNLYHQVSAPAPQFAPPQFRPYHHVMPPQPGMYQPPPAEGMVPNPNWPPQNVAPNYGGYYYERPPEGHHGWQPGPEMMYQAQPGVQPPPPQNYGPPPTQPPIQYAHAQENNYS